MEDQLEKAREDSKFLMRPQFSASEKEDMHEATEKAVQTVKESMEAVNATHQQLMTMCQQKRDLFIVCVKFHMTTRQVRISQMYVLCASSSTYVRTYMGPLQVCTCTYVCTCIVSVNST